MKIKRFLFFVTLLSAILTVCTAILPTFVTSAAEDAIYLGDREDLFLGRESLDGFGWNTAHSGEPITIGSEHFDKGIGFHCLADKDAYAEFDISSLGMTYFAASVGVLKEAGYFIEWGSISFHVYGDGKLLASSPLCNWGDEPYFLTCSIEGVSTLRLVQKNEGNHSCDAGVWGDLRLTMTQPADPSTDNGEPKFDPNKTNEPQPAELVSGDFAYLSDLYWVDNATYSGNVVGRDCNTANEIIFSSDDKFFEKGVGFHAVSGQYAAYIDVNLEGLGYTKFAAYYGVCETLTSHDISMASIKFAVFGDGQKLFESDTVKFGEPMKPMECDITDVKILRLAVAGAPSISGAWGTWGGAVISKSGEINDDMLYSEYTFEPLPPETDAEETQPTEPDTEDTQPTETDTLETSPADTNAAETLPEETQPVTEGLTSAETTLPAEAETLTKPADTEATTQALSSADTASTSSPEETAPPTDSNPESQGESGGCSSLISAATVLFTAASAAVCLSRQKHKED